MPSTSASFSAYCGNMTMSNRLMLIYGITLPRQCGIKVSLETKSVIWLKKADLKGQLAVISVCLWMQKGSILY